LAAFEKEADNLREIGASVYAASVDNEEKAGELAADLSYPVGYGLTRADADSIGAWWEERRGIFHATEFILAQDGTVVSSTYSSGPIGRLDVQDVIRLINFRESQK
jgi:alkyl hydroperoxide reductase subunit AhpC